MFAEAEATSVDLGIAWYRNLVETVFPTDKGVRFYVLRHDGKPVAALPLLVVNQPLGQQVCALANYYSALYAPILRTGIQAPDLVPLLRSILKHEGGVASLRMAPMDPETQSYRTMFEALRLAGMVPFRYFCFGNWYLNVQGDWAQYLADRKGTLRSTIKRMNKKLSQNGGTLEVVESDSECERVIQAYQQVYDQSWKVPEPYPRFVPDLIRLCARNGWMRVGIAWLDGKPLAAQLWIVANGKASIYKVAYDEAYKQFAPGTLVTSALMEHVLTKDAVQEVDYMIGDDKYKQTWMNHRRERWGILAYNPRNMRGLYGLVREMAGKTAKEWVKRYRARFKRSATVATETSGKANGRQETTAD
tara:strand:- start:1411 stop:2493 length:1083 start_codon:yes stop_codon:yes gene_type:complete